MRASIAGLACGIMAAALAGCVTHPQAGPLEAPTAVVPSNYIDVTQAPYGAKGDGKANDSVALSNAVAALKPGGVLYFPPGDYLTGPIEIKIPGVTLLGCSSWRQGTAVESILRPWVEKGNKPLLAVTGPAGVGLRVSHLTLDGKGRNAVGSPITVDYVLVAKGGLEEEKARLFPVLLLEDCKVVNGHSSGLYLDQARGVDIRGCFLGDDGGCGIYANYACDVIVTDSTIVGNNSGISMRSWDRIAITRSRLAKNGQFGFFSNIGSGKTLQISGCYLDHNREAGIALRGTNVPPSYTYSHVLLSDNVFEANQNCHVEFLYVHGAVLTGNAFIAGQPLTSMSSPSPETAFYLVNSPDCTIVGNDLYQGFVKAIMSGATTNTMPVGIDYNIQLPLQY